MTNIEQNNHYKPLLMQIQTLKSTTITTLTTKSTESSTYRKALTIFQSIIESAKDIPNFETNYVNSDPNFALFVFGSAFKLLLKDDCAMKYSFDAMLLLINMMLPALNVGAIKANGILGQLQKRVFGILKEYQGEDRTPLMIRLAVSVLSFTLVNTDNIINDKQATSILCQMLDYAVQSHRTNILSKQASKLLTHIVKSTPGTSKILSKHATNTMLSNIDSSLYLNNIREVIAQFPFQLINDIGYRVCKHISTIQCTTEDEQLYLAQTYFFLEKLAGRFSGETLQEISKQLVGNIPNAAKSESKVVFCYIQALHAILEGLILSNERTGNRYISPVISILQQFISKGGKIEKQATGILRSILSSCIKKSLWTSKQQQDQLDFDNMGLEDNQSNSFERVVAMLQGMVGQQYPNYRGTATILSAFFDSLDRSATDGILRLVDKIVENRDKFEDKYYKKLMHAVYGAVSIAKMCEMYQIGVEGNIGDQNFESANNLWLVYCTQKYAGEEQFNVFIQYYLPLLTRLKSIIKTPNLTPVRVQAYKSLIEMIWRCLKVFCKKPNPHYNYEPIVEVLKNQIGEANDSTLDHIAMALESLCGALHKKEYESKWAGNLISLLAKNLNLQKNNSKQILRAIKYLSSIADKQYLIRVFDKNIVKLIQQKQKGTLNSEQNIQLNLKNLQILIASSNGINFYDPSVVAPYKISREELVVRLIEELITENSLFQKKAYKYIFETLGLMGDSYLNEVIDLLQSNEHKIMAASKHYRLAILMHLWERLSKSEDKINESFEFMKKYLPQILMDMRESNNQRARRQAIAIFQSFCEKIVSMELIENFIQIMCAGLAVDSVETKVSTLSGLAQIYHKKYETSLQFSIGILQIVLMLLYEQKGEIYKAVIEFCRRFIFANEKSKQINHILSTVLQQLFKADLGSKLENRSILKHFLLKITKKFGRYTVQKLIPSEDRKILSNAIKTENRQKRKKRERLRQKRLQAERLKNEKQQDTESEEENEEVHDNEDKMNDEGEDNEQLKQLNNADNLLLKYDLEQQNFHFEEDKHHLKNKQKKEQSKDKQADDITFQDGMMIIKEDPRRVRQQKIEQSDSDAEQNQAQSQSFLNVKKKRKLNDVHQVKQSGATFRSDRAGGDVRLKDKPQPYAFIQFNSKALNKRFKKRAEKVFDTIFERHEGGLKGIKSRIANKGH